MHKKVIIITAIALISVLSLSACKRSSGTPSNAVAETTVETEAPNATEVPTEVPTEAPTETGTAGTESAVTFDYNALEGRITAAYAGVMENTDGSPAGIAYFAMGEGDLMIAAYIDGTHHFNTISEGFDVEDGHILLTDIRNDSELLFIVMPMDDEDEDAFYIGFTDPQVSGFVMPVSAEEIIEAIR